MKVYVTDALTIDLAAEQWECRACGDALGSARENYKRFMALRPRDPREIHAPIIDPSRYEFTFAPDPEWLTIVEYYCPSCGHMAEAEYLPPGHPPTHDIEFDIDALKVKTIYLDQATVLKRFTARAKGRGNRISKPTCHITVTVSD